MTKDKKGSLCSENICVFDSSNNTQTAIRLVNVWLSACIIG